MVPPPTVLEPERGLFVGGSMNLGELILHAAQLSIASNDEALAQQWSSSPSLDAIQYFSLNTPIGAPKEDLCGRIVFTDTHVASGDKVSPFPNGCTTSELTPQERALIAMLFDLSACVQPDDEEPVSPQ